MLCEGAKSKVVSTDRGGIEGHGRSWGTLHVLQRKRSLGCRTLSAQVRFSKNCHGLGELPVGVYYLQPGQGE